MTIPDSMNDTAKPSRGKVRANLEERGAGNSSGCETSQGRGAGVGLRAAATPVTGVGVCQL